MWVKPDRALADRAPPATSAQRLGHSTDESITLVQIERTDEHSPSGITRAYSLCFSVFASLTACPNAFFPIFTGKGGPLLSVRSFAPTQKGKTGVKGLLFLASSLDPLGRLIVWTWVHLRMLGQVVPQFFG